MSKESTQISVDNIVQTVEYADVTDLQEIKELDDLAFGIGTDKAHLGITLDELQKIHENGFIIYKRNENGLMVMQCQLLTAPISYHPNLQQDEAYCYGTAVHPDFKHQGYAQTAYAAQEELAKKIGKKRITSTIRVENMNSLRARTKFGFQIVGYSPKEYGPIEEDGARFFAEKHLKKPFDPIDTFKAGLAVMEGEIPIITPENSNELLGTTTIALPVLGGDAIYYPAHKLIPSIFDKGYIGEAILKPSEFGNALEQLSLIVFRRNFNRGG